uniref:DDE_Tnp_IS1595 domain-containing protein n=1 Tax=Meloidogyne hapla TaxID=6305 RepID=A0A1I8B7A7_MELHA
MFNNLQVESKLDIFKYLNIEQLTSVRQTNNYFNALIGRYEGELAREKLYSIEIVVGIISSLLHVELCEGYNYKFISLQDGVFKLKITDQLMEKFSRDLDKIVGCIERSEGGQAIVEQVPNRKRKTLFKLIKKWIKPKTLIISDEWPSYLQLEKHLPQYKHMLIRHKKQTGGGFSKVIAMEDGTVLNVNTNKCEGLWAHLKHKTKRIYGTTTKLLNSYMMEALFRQNTRAKKENIFCAFYIETSKDYSNMVKYISFNNCSWPIFNLSERAELIKSEQHFIINIFSGVEPGLLLHYQITNIHNPKVKFSISYFERNGLIYFFDIERIN